MHRLVLCCVAVVFAGCAEELPPDTYAASEDESGILCYAQCTDGTAAGSFFNNVDVALNNENCTAAVALHCKPGDRCSDDEAAACEVDG